MFKGLKPILYGGREVWPLVEGGKGVSATNHMSSGAWAAAGGIGTVSAVNADSYDAEGKIVPQVYKSLTRKERHEELIHYGVEGAVAQVERAYEVSGGKGAININVLWEMGGAQQILEGVLARTKGMVAGVTCGAGMPYKLSEIAERHNVMYLPIISSARAFRALWKRAYHKVPHLLGAVVYEDPWLAGGHNGLSNAEDPLVPQDPYPRVKALRDVMTAEGIADSVPIVMAGGVWYLRDWENWIDNPELGQIVFQYGTRPLLTEESPIPQAWKDRLRTLDD
ncbi:MAG: nitronate monooxygenase, partial [Alphaproteobacteria bacterium]|nr:nitronate monooxygenase [Alphaproteobacteria bacterium]